MDARAGLYRSILSGRKILIVLDNARDAEQVRPLLPGTTGCLVLVTSRDQLSGLVSAEGAYPITLDLPSWTEARQLLAARLGSARVAVESDAVNQIIASCARLPLALAIASARAATHPGFALGALATELRAAGHRLDRFAGSDMSTDVRAVFSWSYRALSPDAARLFRLLGTHPGPDLAAPAAASLAAIPLTRCNVLLAELANAHLVTEHTEGRFMLHDLLRAHATELTHREDSESDRRSTRHRTYGGGNDVPVVADWTGDGKADRGVWRPSTGHWFMPGVYDGGSYGGNGDIPLATPPQPGHLPTARTTTLTQP